MNKVIIARNPLEASTWETFEDVEDIRDFIMEEFSEWPATARIYHEQVSEENDVTPSDENSIELLSKLEGTFFVVVYPGDPTTIIVSVLAIAAAAAAAFFLAPALPTLNRNVGSPSPNNELSNRTNQARPKGRIPDIFGTVNSIPDLIALPYKVFENNIEVEYAYMCVGKGEYSITEIKDDKTLISSIEGAKAEVYAPFTSPNSGDAPQLSIGDPIDTPILNVQRSNAVNGQLLAAPNANTIKGSNYIKPIYPNIIAVSTGEGIDFRDVFAPGQDIIVTDFVYGAVSFAGTFLISSVTQYEIGIVPSGGWLDPSWTGASVGVYQSPTLYRLEQAYVGPFIIEGVEFDELFANFVASNGLYKDNGTSQYSVQIEIQIEVTNLDAANVPIGSPYTDSIVLKGSSVNRDAKASTLKTAMGAAVKHSIRARRLTFTDSAFNGQVVDEVRWRDLYAVAPVDDLDFGDITTIQSVTVATSGALNVKDRKLNMLVTRKVPLRISGDDFTPTLHATNRASEILAFILQDPYIGNRSSAEIDFENLYSTLLEVEIYFGTIQAVEFCYTFDDSNISFEETISLITSNVFCVAYRRGSVIKLSFERETSDSTLLFNHRNKLPDTEIRSIQFGISEDNDGVEFEYTSPDDGGTLTYYIPEDQSALNPKNIKIVGVRSRLKARFHAYRAWNKLQFQNMAVEFEATQEADILVVRDRILNTDNTRAQSMDGQIDAQNGLELTLSQAIELGSDDYSIFLQHIDGTIESIPITPGDDDYHVILGRAPRAPLSVASDLYAKATFAIVGTSGGRTQPFLVVEKNPNSNFTLGISAVNYDDRYYANDLDYVNGIVDINGN